MNIINRGLKWFSFFQDRATQKHMAALEHSKLGSKVKSYVHVLSNWLVRANRFDLVLAATEPPPPPPPPPPEPLEPQDCFLVVRLGICL